MTGNETDPKCSYLHSITEWEQLHGQVKQPDTALSTLRFPGVRLSARLVFLPSSSLPSPSVSSWLLGCMALISIIKSTWGMNIQGITFLIPIPVLSSIFPSMHAAKIASAWRWELMDNQEGMVNRGHRTKYYLRAQYAVTQMTFLQGNSNISLRANEWCASFPLLNCSLIETKHEKGCKYF